MSFKFRFYGRKPTGQYDYGYLTSHGWDVAFRSEPSDAQKQQLATWYESIDAGAARAGDAAWLWSGRFARVPFKEYDFQKLFATVAKHLEVAHAIAAIEDVVYCGSQGAGRGPWQKWSEARQAQPTPGPAYADGTSPRAHDASLADAAADPGFEAERGAARLAKRAAELEALNEGSPISLRPLPIDPTGPRFAAAEAALAEAGITAAEGEKLQPATQVGRMTYLRRGEGLLGFSYLDDGALRDVSFDDGVELRGTIAVRGDGLRGIAITDWDHVDEIDFTTGTAKRRMTTQVRSSSLGYVGALWSLRSFDGLSVVDPAHDPPKLVASAKLKGEASSWHEVLLGGRVIVANSSGKTENTVVIGFCEGKLKKLVTLKIRPSYAFERDGEVVIATSGRREVLALGGLLDVYDRWAAPIRAKADKQRAGNKSEKGVGAKPKRATKLTLEPVDAAPDPPSVAASDDQKARFDGTAYARTAGGVVAAIVRLDEEKWNEYTPAYFVDDGPVTYISLEEAKAINVWAPGSPTLSPDGDLAVFPPTGTNHWLLVVEPRTGAFTSFEQSDYSGKLTTLHVRSPDTLVLHSEPLPRAKGNRGRHIDLVVREKKKWKQTDTISVTRSRAIVAREDVLVVLCDGTTTAVIYAIAGDNFVKVGAFKERVRSAVFDEAGRLLFVTPEDAVFEVVGLHDVVAKKLAAAEKKKK